MTIPSRRVLPPALAAACLLASAPARAARPLTPPAPEFPDGSAWFNSRDLSMRRFLGKRVVVVSFVNFSTLNSLRTLPALQAWWDRYSQNGLMVVGVHAADFESDRDLGWVRARIRRLGLRFPIVIDNDRRIWKSFANEGWPAHFLIDHEGLIVHDRVGEGGYHEMEREIREALRRFNWYRPPADLEPLADPPSAECGESTPLRYVGGSRGRQINLTGKRETQRVLSAARDGEVSYAGKWVLEPDGLRNPRDNPGLSDTLRLIYRGAESAAMLSQNRGSPAKVFLKQDDMWLHANNGGADVQWDLQDRSFVAVAEPRLYHLTKNVEDDMHELILYPEDPGPAVHAFDFSNRCQISFDHR